MATRLIPLALLLLLCTAPPAAALETPVGELPILAFEDDEPEAEAAATEEAEESFEECDEFEEGFEECEEFEEEDRRRGNSREACLLRSARAHASVDPRQKLKLTIGYTTYEPVKAKIKVGRVATLQRYLGYSGVLRITKKLKTKSGKRLVVSIKIPSAKNAGCPHRRLVLIPH